MSVNKRWLLGFVLYALLWLFVILGVVADKHTPESTSPPVTKHQTGWDPDEVRVLEIYKFEGSLEGTFTPDK